jgi:hypothetical protein
MLTPIQAINELKKPDHAGRELKAEILETVQLLNQVYIAGKKMVNDQCYAQDISARCPKSGCPLYALCKAVAAFDKKE